MHKQAAGFEIKAHAGTIREVLGLSAPLIIANMSQSMMWVVDTFVMGRVGNAEQGAVVLAGVLVWASVSFFIGTMSVINILVAQDYGAGRQDLARHVRAGLLLALPMSALVIALWPLVPHALTLMHVADATRPFAQTYLQIRLPSAPLILGTSVFASYLRGVGDTVTPMVVVLVANAINAVVSVVLVFGWLGFPALGVAGAAIGTVAACAAELGMYAAVFWFGERSRANGSRVITIPSRAQARQLLSLGAPIGLAWLFEMVAWTSFSIYAGSRPPEELAA
ncbi:MAG: MATE family efflux transporter, partial [Polyangiaceae bacterium]|nr:MATE family efflux transporter [Polyangiaceae bacterium]